MKKNYILLVLLFVSLTTVGQITVTNDDFIPLNSTLIIGNDTLPDASIVPGPAGANQSWDFSAATANSSDTMLTLSPGQTPMAQLFPESNYAAFQPGDSVYVYFNRNDDKVQLIGIGFDTDSAFLPYIKYTPAETLLDFPVNFGDDYTQTYYTDITLASPEPGADSIRMKNTIVDQTTVDAYGSLTTPLGTFNTLRSKDFQISYDTIWAQVFNVWIPVSAEIDTSISYSWWTNDVSIGFMLFSIDMEGTTNEVSDVSYLVKSIQSIHQTNTNSAKIFPNPAKASLNIQFEKPVSGQLAIYNQAGQLVKQVELSNQRSHHLSVAMLPSGIYVYKVYSNVNNTLYQGKFMKQ